MMQIIQNITDFISIGHIIALDGLSEYLMNVVRYCNCVEVGEYWLGYTLMDHLDGSTTNYISRMNPEIQFPFSDTFPIRMHNGMTTVFTFQGISTADKQRLSMV